MLVQNTRIFSRKLSCFVLLLCRGARTIAPTPEGYLLQFSQPTYVTCQPSIVTLALPSRDCSVPPSCITLHTCINFAWGAGKVPGTHDNCLTGSGLYFRDPPAPPGCPMGSAVSGYVPRARMYAITSLMSRTDTLWQGLV